MHPTTAQLIALLISQFDAVARQAEQQIAELKKENAALLARLAAREAVKEQNA